jgi:uncharacterized protein YndB with AHSA1/START domain
MRVELQAEVPARREDVFALVSTLEGLRRWLDEAVPDPGAATGGTDASGTADRGTGDDEAPLEVGGRLRVRMHEAIAECRVTSLEVPQHVGLTWSWAPGTGVPPAAAGDRPTAVAFDLIDHGGRTHLTLRHVGLATHAEAEAHEQAWRHWFARLVRAAREGQPASRVERGR